MFFPHQTDGSFITRDRQTVGSALIGRNFAGKDHRTPDQALLVTLTRQHHHDAFLGLPGRGDAVLEPVALQALLDPVGDPQQGEFTQRGEITGPEVVGQRHIDPVGRVDVAVDHTAPQCLRRHVDQLDLLGLAPRRGSSRSA